MLVFHCTSFTVMCCSWNDFERLIRTTLFIFQTRLSMATTLGRGPQLLPTPPPLLPPLQGCHSSTSSRRNLATLPGTTLVSSRQPGTTRVTINPLNHCSPDNYHHRASPSHSNTWRLNSSSNNCSPSLSARTTTSELPDSSYYYYNYSGLPQNAHVYCEIRQPSRTGFNGPRRPINSKRVILAQDSDEEEDNLTDLSEDEVEKLGGGGPLMGQFQAVATTTTSSDSSSSRGGGKSVSPSAASGRRRRQQIRGATTNL